VWAPRTVCGSTAPQLWRRSPVRHNPVEQHRSRDLVSTSTLHKKGARGERGVGETGSYREEMSENCIFFVEKEDLHDSGLIKCVLASALCARTQGEWEGTYQDVFLDHREEHILSQTCMASTIWSFQAGQLSMPALQKEPTTPGEGRTYIIALFDETLVIPAERNEEQDSFDVPDSVPICAVRISGRLRRSRQVFSLADPAS
jgi:hypothetical protein